MNKPMPVNPPELRSTFVAASSMPWQPTDFEGIEMKILYQDDEGRSTILFKMAPGAVVPLHEHTALEQTYMLIAGRRGRGLRPRRLRVAAGRQHPRRACAKGSDVSLGI
jgi:mannose-6-phosphate isomerase-like protein (cupin superfamily)